MNLSVNIFRTIEEILWTIKKLKNCKPTEQPVQNQNIEEHQLLDSVQEGNEKNSLQSSDRTCSEKIASQILLNNLFNYIEDIKRGVDELVKQNQNCKCQQFKDLQNINQGKNKYLLFVKSENTYDKSTDSNQNKVILRNLKQDLQDTKTSLIQQQKQLSLQIQEMNQILENKNMLDSTQKRQKIFQFEYQQEESKENLIALKQIQDLNKKLVDLDISYQEKLKLCKAKFGIKN
ncbi:unnamed protein product [Paramecium pentaurelia]|uniref:Uncharacterized protein n=1 Tax=Paramecium pentaurelia TaxID=43138 RepID=A0A8S1S0V5_9CILI|nr:unnamed protein product [Paramecium pentaurelia]